MSTILNALKKLESDSSAAADLPQAQVGRRSKQFGQPKTRIILLAFALAVCLAAAAGFYSQFHPRRHIAGTTGSSRNAEEASRKGEPAGAVGTSGSKEPAKDPEIIPASASAEKKGKQPVRQPKIRGLQSAEKPAATEQIKPRSDTKPESARPRKEQAVEAAAGAGKAPDAYPVLADTGIRIQAISWNSDPARRIAVINSRICRQGDRVNGYQIIAINPDDIVLSAGGSTGKVPF